MPDMFTVLPKIQYNGHVLTDLTARAEIYRKILKKVPAFYDYNVKDGERPDTVAYDYYGSSDYTWLVCMSANVHNVFTDWPLTYQEFRTYLTKKYSNIESIMSEVHHYVYTGVPGTDSVDDIGRKSWKMTETTYLALPFEEKAGWTPITVYQYEDDLNERKRHIKLLSNRYLDQVDRELLLLFNGTGQ